MRNCRFTDAQIIGALKTVAAGRLVKDVFRKQSILEATDIKRLNDQEEESRKLKIMVTDLSLEIHARFIKRSNKTQKTTI